MSIQIKFEVVPRGNMWLLWQHVEGSGERQALAYRTKGEALRKLDQALAFQVEQGNACCGEVCNAQGKPEFRQFVRKADEDGLYWVKQEEIENA